MSSQHEPQELTVRICQTMGSGNLALEHQERKVARCRRSCRSLVNSDSSMPFGLLLMTSGNLKLCFLFFPESSCECFFLKKCCQLQLLQHIRLFLLDSIIYITYIHHRRRHHHHHHHHLHPSTTLFTSPTSCTSSTSPTSWTTYHLVDQLLGTAEKNKTLQGTCNVDPPLEAAGAAWQTHDEMRMLSCMCDALRRSCVSDIQAVVRCKLQRTVPLCKSFRV